MIKTWITGVKLSRYALQFKQQIGVGMMLLALGLLVEITSHGTNMIGGFYIALSGTTMIQLIVSIGNSTVVQTSPYRKKLQTLVPALCGVMFSLLTYTLYVIMQVYFNYFWRGTAGSASDWSLGMDGSGALLLVGILLFFTEIYIGVLYKYFVLSMVIFIPVMCCIIVNASDYSEAFMQFSGKLGFGGCVAFGYAAILLGMFLAYTGMVLLYKKPLSKYAFGAYARRSLGR